MDDRSIQIQRLKRLFVQFVDTLINAPARFDSLPDKILDFQSKIDLLVQDGPGLTPDELISRFRAEISPAIPQLIAGVEPLSSSDLVHRPSLFFVVQDCHRVISTCCTRTRGASERASVHASRNVVSFIGATLGKPLGRAAVV